MAKYKYIIDKTKEPFVNPYNFVTIDFDTKSKWNKPNYGEELLTGWMDYSLIVRTPISIPDTETGTDGQIMIPGSSIRGVIRNVFETATDSCFSTVRGGEGAKKQIITKRRSASRDIKPGLLIKNADKSWELFDADFYMLKSKDYQRNKNKNNKAPNSEIWDNKKCPAYIVNTDERGKYISTAAGNKYSGDKVWFVPLVDDLTGKAISFIKTVTDKNTGKPKSNSCGKVVQEIVADGNIPRAVNGVLVIGEDVNIPAQKMFSNKHHERIFVKGSVVSSVSSQEVECAIEGLEATIAVYNDESINRTYGKAPGYHGGYKAYKEMKKNGIIPVYYSKEQGNLYLQAAPIGRVAFNSDMYSLVGNKRPCKKRNELCKSCSLFGMVGEEAVGSRLRFSDLDCTSDSPTLYSRTLDELGGPKMSYMPFYSNMGWDEDPSVVGYDDEGIELRGRKFYWHHKPSDDNLYAEKGKRNATMELVGQGTVFEGKVFFDKITDTELRELIWTMNFWENDADGRYCHKIGHGKPLGLGSCKLIVNGIFKRQLSENSYIIKPIIIDYSKPDPIDDSDTVADLLTICDIKAMENMKVMYPYIFSDTQGKLNSSNDNDFARHRWFTENKQKRNRDKMMLLPFIDEDQRLYPFTAKSINNNAGSSGNNNNSGGKYRKNNNWKNKGKK